MKTARVVIALSVVLVGVAAPVAADSSYEACVKFGGPGAPCVKPAPFVAHEPPPMKDPLAEFRREMAERERAALLNELQQQRAAEVYHGSYLRLCRQSSPACRAGLLD